jgi:UDP-N-acetyl-D-galactosamine dehydrogenase
MALPEEAEREYGLRLLPREALPPAAAVVFGVAHDCFVAEGWRLIAGLLRNETGIVLDVEARLSRADRPEGIELWRL